MIKDIDNQRILQSHWKTAFWSIIYEFSHTRGLHRKIENDKIFHFRLLPAKMKNFSKNSKKKKKQVLAYFAHFKKNTNFPKKSAP